MKKYTVVFETKAPYSARVSEEHKSLSDARLRACALGWTIIEWSLIDEQ